MNSPETTNQKYARLLKFFAATGKTISSDENTLLDDIFAVEELLSEDYLTGSIGRDSAGQACCFTCVRINSRGRAYLTDLERKAVADTSFGFIKQHRFSFYKWVFGIVATIIAGYYVWHITH